MSRVHWDPAHVSTVSIATESGMPSARPFSRGELIGVLTGGALLAVCVGLLIWAGVVS